MTQSAKTPTKREPSTQVTASHPIRFGRQAVSRSPFTINELEFSSLPLSLAEEKQLAGAGESGDGEMVDALLDVLTTILNARATGEGTVSTEWLLNNLTPDDLEGIVEYLRSGQAGEVQDG